MWLLWQAKLHNISSTTTTAMEKSMYLSVYFSVLSVSFFYCLCLFFVFRCVRLTDLHLIDRFTCDLAHRQRCAFSTAAGVADDVAPAGELTNIMVGCRWQL